MSPGVKVDQFSFDHYATAARAASKIFEMMTEFAVPHLEVVKAFSCQVTTWPVGADSNDLQMGATYCVILGMGTSEATVELHWRAIGRGKRQPTADEIANAFTLEDARTKKTAHYGDSLMAAGVWRLTNRAEAIDSDQKLLLERLYSVS
jgi:hypothetical protein